MIYSISRRAHTHKDNCEDAHFTLDFPSMIIFGAFDGCSSGKDTYFASALLARCVKKVFIDHHKIAKGLYNMSTFAGIDGDTINQILHSAGLMFRQSAIMMELTELELLTTCVIGIYIKNTKKLLYKFLGDGSIYWITEGSETLQVKKIDFPENKPDYMAYHFSKNILHWIKEQPEGIIENVKEFSVCTDGIDSVKFHQPSITVVGVEDYLLKDKDLQTSAKMLHRKINMLEKDKIVFDDDLTILRYIP